MEDTIRRYVIQEIISNNILESYLNVIITTHKYNSSVEYKIVVLYNGMINDYVGEIMKGIKFEKSTECYYNEVGKCLVILLEREKKKVVSPRLILDIGGKDGMFTTKAMCEGIIMSYIRRNMKDKAKEIYLQKMIKKYGRSEEIEELLMIEYK